MSAMDAELIAIAEAAAVTLVKAMATDLWPETRKAVVALFHRSDRKHRTSIGTRLDDNAALVRRAEAPDQARQQLLGYWIPELTALLRNDPACRAALTDLAGRAGDALPQARTTRSTQINTAQAYGTVLAVQNGDQHAYLPAPQGNAGGSKPSD
jgi:hypothetical protein